MFAEIIILIAAIVIVLLYGDLVGKRLRFRSQLTSMLALADQEFYKAVHSILKTPEDLSDEILESISMMSETIADKNGEKLFLDALRRVRSRAEKNSLPDPSEALRPELQVLYQQAVNSWAKAMTFKSIRYFTKISREMTAINISKKGTSLSADKVAKPVVFDLAKQHTACSV